MHRFALASSLGLALALAGCASAEAAKEHEKAGLTALGQGRAEDARVELEAAVAADPGLYQAAVALSMLDERAGDAALAVRVLEDCVAAQPRLALAHMALADLDARLGLYDQALVQYGRVAQISSHAPALLAMAAIYMRRGEEASAEQAILAALEAQPGDPDALFGLARLYDERPHAQDAARAAWERYVKLAGGNPREKNRVEAGKARLRLLSARLSRDEEAAALAATRALLRPPAAAGRVLPGPTDAALAAEPDPVTLGVRGVEALGRYFTGRIHVTLYAPHAVAVRGSGRGATLYEGLAAAVLDAKQSRVFDLQYARELGHVRVALDVEAEEPKALTLAEGESGVPVAAEGFRPGEDALEVRRGERSAFVLPADATALGLTTLGDAIGVAARELGVERGAWRGLAAWKFRTTAFVEAADATPRPLELEAGLPAAPAASAEEAAATARAAGLWIASTLGGGGVFAEGYDPADDRYAAGVTGTAVQLEAIVALYDLGQKLGEPRLEDAARAAYRANVTDAAPRGPALRAALRLDRGRALELAPAVGAALPLAEAAVATKAPLIREGASTIAREDLPALATLLAGGDDPALEPQAKALAARAVAAARAAPADDLASLEALAAASRLPKALRPEGLREALERAVAATERLSIDDRASYPFRERTRVLGGFRTGPLAPAIRTEAVVRRAAALLAALPFLESAARAPAR